MPYSYDDFINSPVGMFLVIMCSFYLSFFLLRAVARRTLLPPVYRFLIKQREQQQQELERQARLHFYLDDARRRAVTAAAAAEHARGIQEGQAWLEMMEDSRRRHEGAIQAHEPAVAAKQTEEFTERLRRDIDVKLGLLEADDEQREDSLALAEYFDTHQYHPVKGGLLYDSDDEDPAVIRGDRKGKKDK